MNFLSIDIGTKTGFCIFNSEGVILKSGTANFSQKAGSHLGKRFAVFSQWLSQIVHRYDVKHVVYEAVYAHTSIEASHVYGGFLYSLASHCYCLDIELTSLGVCTIKKLATGYGRAKKFEVIAMVEALGFTPVDDNEADAIAIMIAFQKIQEGGKNHEK